MTDEGLDELDFRHDALPGAEGVEEASLNLKGVIQGMRLAFDVRDHEYSGKAELLVMHEGFDIDWACDAADPPQWMRLTRGRGEKGT